MRGHIRPRGPGAWEIKFDAPSDTGERRTRYVTFRGGKREAQAKLTELLHQVNTGSFIDRRSVAELRDHWRQQQEQRLALGLGKAGPDDLAFAQRDGMAWPPDSVTADWARTLRVLKLPKVTLHALRHTHVPSSSPAASTS